MKDLAVGTSSHEVLKRLESSKRPVVILGADQLKTSEGPALLAYTQELALRLQDKLENKDWKVSSINLYISVTLLLLSYFYLYLLLLS